MNRQSKLPLPLSQKEKTKDWQLEMLMEKLRSKASQYKSIPEISKNVRMTLLEKRYASDSVEKSQHQKCLDTLQHSIKVTSLQSMVERLECLTRQLGLKFVVEPSGVFISSDMFYLEVVLDASGAVKDVKVHHEGKKEQQSCLELADCLSGGDFSDFTAQLEGFASVYQLNAEKKVKCKAFTALESLEADLSTLAQLQMFMIEPFNLIHKSPVGVLEKRRGGHPMKLTYFVSPYDLLNVETNEMDAIVVENVTGKNLGYSVTVCMEGSAAHKLQTTTLITVNRNMSGKSTPSYTPLTGQNSAVVPACFVLKLNKPLPMSVALVRQIQQIHPWAEIDAAPVRPLLNLIVTHCSEGKMTSSNNKGLFVTLPDQNHCYFMTENKNMNGVLVNSIPFAHPAHVSSILTILREQALFNSIIGSCVRPNSKQDFENMTMFEVSALSSTHVSVSLEHPSEESMATAEVDLSDVSGLACRVAEPGNDAASELAGKVLNKSFSLPVALRAVIKMWEKQSTPRRTPYGGGPENFSLPLGSGDPGGRKEPPGSNASARFGSTGGDKVKQEPAGGGAATGHGMTTQQQAESMMTQNFQQFPPSDGVLANMELNNMLADASDKLNKRQKRKLNEDAWKIGKRKVGTAAAEEAESAPLSSPEPRPPAPDVEPEKPEPDSDEAERVENAPAEAAATVENDSGVGAGGVAPGSGKPVEEKAREKKSKSNREDKSRLEKKKRKKHDDGGGPMGPPDKVPFKSDAPPPPKPTGSPPAPASPGATRKYGSSPADKAGRLKPAASSSPRSGGSSPVGGGGGSGKPSISALKSAAGSPKAKSGSSRDKEKKSSSTRAPKSGADASSDGAADGAGDAAKACPANQARNRKGSLSAIVDKLKVNAQHCDLATDLSGGGKAAGEPKSSEYMVKPSSDGMKITINKTRSKEAAGGKGSGAGGASKGGATGSPKTHTGLKPGVNSGPASKKPQQQLQKPNAAASATVNNYNNNLKGSAPKAAGGGAPKAVSKSGGGGADPGKSKDRVKAGRSPREEVDSVYRMTQSSLSIKTLDKNFQIPKLSARMNEEKKMANNVSKTATDAKTYNSVAKNDSSVSKYPAAAPGGKIFDGALELKMRNSVNSASADDGDAFRAKDAPQNLSNNVQGKEDCAKPFSVTSSEPLGLSAKSVDLTSKFVVPAPKDDRKDFRKNDEVLDFSTSSKALPSYPHSPSVSVHIVKSPGPLAASPCITDDELMDEALVGPGK